MKYLSECFIWPVCIFICLSLQAVCTNSSYLHRHKSLNAHLPGTTHVPILRDVFPSSNIVPLTGKDFIQGFVDGRCNVLAGEQNDISETSVRIAGYIGDYEYGNRVLSKEPLGE